MASSIALALVAATATLRVDVGTPLERADRDGSTHAARAASAPGTTGGPDQFRAAVDRRAAAILAVTYRRAHGEVPRRVQVTAEGLCDGAVPRLSHRRVRADISGVRRRFARELCLAVGNANYEIDKVTIAEWAARYDAIAVIERVARRRAARSGSVPRSGAVRSGCAS